MQKGKGGCFPQPPNLKPTTVQRQSFSTGVDKLAIRSCGHHRATVRNVTTSGAAAYICRGCYCYLRNVEFKAVARRQFDALFVNLLPLGEIRGAQGRGAYV